MSQMEALAGLFDPPARIATLFSSECSKTIKANEETILAMLKRRPCTFKQIQRAFAMHINEVSKYLGVLMAKEKIHADSRNQEVYYRPL